MLSVPVWRLALAAHVLLLMLVALREWSPLGGVLAGLLLLPLPGLWRQQPRTAAWGGMLVAFYAAGYLAAGYAQAESRVTCFALASLAALDYLSLLAFARFRSLEIKRSRSAAQTAG
jgi:uncharacterized membrane protein